MLEGELTNEIRPSPGVTNLSHMPREKTYKANKDSSTENVCTFKLLNFAKIVKILILVHFTLKFDHCHALSNTCAFNMFSWMKKKLTLTSFLQFAWFLVL